MARSSIPEQECRPTQAGGYAPMRERAPGNVMNCHAGRLEVLDKDEFGTRREVEDRETKGATKAARRRRPQSQAQSI